MKYQISRQVLFILIRNSSNALSTMVPLYPRSALQAGQVLVRASSPVYHPLMHTSHPSRTLQKFVAISGGVMVSWQILHLKVSINRPFIPIIIALAITPH